MIAASRVRGRFDLLLADHAREARQPLDRAFGSQNESLELNV